MQHPSKVGAFCARKGDKKLGGGTGPLPCGKHLKRGPKRRHAAQHQGWPFWKRLRARRLRDARRATAKHQSAADSDLPR